MKLYIFIFVLFSSACSYSSLNKVSYFRFDNQITKNNKTFELKSFFLKEGFTSYNIYSQNGYNYFDINISENEVIRITILNRFKEKLISHIWLPIIFWIPTPPLIPNFFNSTNKENYNNSKLTVVVKYFGNKKFLINQNQIFLIDKNNNKIYCDKTIYKNNNRFEIVFPINENYIENITILFNGFYIDNNNIFIPKSIIKYVNGYFYSYGSIL